MQLQYTILYFTKCDNPRNNYILQVFKAPRITYVCLRSVIVLVSFIACERVMASAISTVIQYILKRVSGRNVLVSETWIRNLNDGLHGTEILTVITTHHVSRISSHLRKHWWT